MRHRSHFNVILWLILSVMGAGLCNVSVAQITWDNDDGDEDWFAGANWSGQAVPGSGDSVHLNANSSETTPVQINNAAMASTLDLALGNGASDAGYLDIYTDLTSAGDVTVGNAGTGVVRQFGGAVTFNGVSTLSIGDASTATGSVAMIGGRLSVHILELKAGMATFTHTNGVVAVRDSVKIAHGGNLPSVYRMTGSGATLAVTNSLTVGNFSRAGNGLVNQQGGTVSVGTSLYVGSAGGSNQSTNHAYRMRGGRLDVGNDIYVGYTGGEGFFEHTGGSVTIADEFYVGRSGNSAYLPMAEYSVSGSAELTVGDNMEVGSDLTYAVTGTVRFATSHSGSITCNDWVQRGGGRGVLAVDVDSAICDPIMVDNSITFASGSVLLPNALPGAVPGDFTILTCGGSLADEGLQFASAVDTATWRFSTAGNALTLTYAPPPPRGAVIIIR